MLKKIFKWIGIVLGILIVVAGIFYMVVYFSTKQRIDKVYEVAIQMPVIPTDSASYERGKHIATNRGCFGCHGANLGGYEEILPPGSPPGTLVARNITSGEGGIQYTDEDWVRLFRHGINKEGQSVWFMPSNEVAHLSNRDLGDLICYLKQQAPVNNKVPEREIKPLGRILVFFNQFPLLTAELIDHKATFKDVIEPSVSTEYGAYLATTCQGCHSPTLKGAKPFEKGKPPFPDITSSGHLGKWTASQFTTVMRTGKRPDGVQLSDAMPYKYFNFTDNELNALFLYLHQLH